METDSGCVGNTGCLGYLFTSGWSGNRSSGHDPCYEILRVKWMLIDASEKLGKDVIMSSVPNTQHRLRTASWSPASHCGRTLHYGTSSLLGRRVRRFLPNTWQQWYCAVCVCVCVCISLHIQSKHNKLFLNDISTNIQYKRTLKRATYLLLSSI